MCTQKIRLVDLTPKVVSYNLNFEAKILLSVFLCIGQ